mmetsp:Transcript_31007/g.81089  ORF Transcript_31007/g.81089 Transcript_31007/m.81089 type:complete len:146 (+) Transcript_31007:787-1224(+)
MKQIGATFEELRTDSNVSTLLELWQTYEGMMLPHLKEEGQILIPLMWAYFPQHAASAKVGQLMQKMDPRAIGIVAYWINFSDPDSFSKVAVMSMMKQEGIPCFVYYIVFKQQISKYIASFIEPYRAIRDDINSTPNQKQTLFCLM